MNKEHSELEKKVNFWLSKLQVKTVQQHPPVQITDEDEANLEKAVTGILNLIQTSNKEIEKAYGSCHKCYGKGYATTIDYSTGGRMTTINPIIRYCSCERGKQLEKLNELSNKEARIDEINLFREAMINHSTPMIYAPDRIKQLKQEEAK